MPIVRDLKRRDSRKILILNKEEKIEQKNKPVTEVAHRKIIDVKAKNQQKDYIIFSIGSENKDKKQSSKYKNFFTIIATGVIVVFIINIFSISNQLFNISNNIEADAFAGYDMFLSGGKNAGDANFGGAIQSFEAANKAFTDAQNKIWFLGDQSLLSMQGIGSSAYSILESGKLLSDAASYFSQGISELNEVPILFVQNNTSASGTTNQNKISLSEKLKSSLNLFNQAFENVKLAQEKLISAGPLLLPDKFKSQFNLLTQKLDELVLIIDEIKVRIPPLLKLLGDRYPHRYLVLLQNNTESRPTGGFIGSYMIIDVNDGYIEKSEFHDVYESDGQLNEFIPAPEEMAELTTNWRMRDSNYSPDFALSAAKAAWFLEKEEGPGVDSVIAINQSFLMDLFAITGPVQIDGLSAPLTGNNYNTVLTYIVEAKLEGANDPKAVLNRFIPVLQKKLYDKASFKNLFSVIQKGISEKQILAWSKDEDIENLFNDIGISGLIKKTQADEDYLNLSAINIGGNKSDLYIQPEILHETMIYKNGEVLDKLTYTRKHTWTPEILLEWQKQLEPFGYSDLPEYLQNILGRGNNKSVIKVFLPKGSEIQDVVGLEKNDIHSGIDENLDKTYIYFTLEVAPQNERKVSILYKLPYKLDLFAADEYRMTVQKQPGSIVATKLIKRIAADPNIKNLRNYPDEVVYTDGKLLEYQTTLSTDQYFASLWSLE